MLSGHSGGPKVLPETVRRSIRILIVDDHPAILLGLSNMLSEDEDLEVVGTARNGHELERLDSLVNVDVFLLDLRMPGMSSTECIRLVQQRAPAAHILLISSYEMEEEIAQALEAGASGFVSKNADQEEISTAIRKVHSGVQRLPTALARRIAERNQRDALSRRELQVLRGVAKGLTSREMATQMGLSEYTVRNHVNSIISKLQVRDRTEAAVVAIKKGLVAPED